MHGTTKAGQGRAGQGSAKHSKQHQNQSTAQQHGQREVDDVLTRPRPTPCRKTMGRVNDNCCLADSSAEACAGSWLDSDPRGPDVGSRTQYDIPCQAATLFKKCPIAMTVFSCLTCTSRINYIVLPRCAAGWGGVGGGGGALQIAMTAGEGGQGQGD